MRNNVLVITSSFDTHADVICPKIQDSGVRIFRFNTDELERYEIGLIPTTAALSIVDKVEQKRITPREIGSVWYRRPSSDKTIEKSLDDESIKLFKYETKGWVKSITFGFENSFWVTAPWLLYKSRIKSNQLLVAHSVGLNVPKTLITRDSNLVKRFYDECPNGIVAKSLKVPFVESKDVYHSLRTQEITPSDLSDSSLYICPTIFQERISVSYELRVVAIGRRLFAFKVTTKEKCVTDIRASGKDNIEYTPWKISPALSDKILSLLNRFNLPFSSMDLLVDQTGNEFFIDLNPNGQWLWLEYTAGVIMSDLFVEMMISGQMPA